MSSRWRLEDGIEELQREQEARSRTWPQLLARGVISEDEIKAYGAALQGTIKFLEFCKAHEDALRAFMREQLAGR